MIIVIVNFCFCRVVVVSTVIYSLGNTQVFDVYTYSNSTHNVERKGKQIVVINRT